MVMILPKIRIGQSDQMLSAPIVDRNVFVWNLIRLQVIYARIALFDIPRNECKSNWNSR